MAGADLFDDWDRRREQRNRPAGPVDIPALPADPSRAAAYARAALEGEVRNILAVPIGSGRNDQLNKSALKMFGYVEAGAIDERTVFEVLGAADGGLDYPDTIRTLRSAREAARRYGAKPIPEQAPHPSELADLPDYLVSDDPFSPYFRAALNVPPAAGLENGASDAAEPAGAGAQLNADTSDDPDPAFRALVVAEAASQRVRREARRLVDQEEAARTFRVPLFADTLADELAIPDQPVTYRVSELLPSDGNVLLTAQYKAGKTTLISNLARALVDDEPFLGKYPVAPVVDGRVVIFNYEVGRDQYRRWLRDLDIVNKRRVNVLPLRGYRLPLLTPSVEDWTVEYLKRAECEVWFVDPFARAAVGSVTNENDNTEVGAFLDALDVIKERAGVRELILPTHTGRGEHEPGEERARGATRLDDWADVRWLLTRDKHGGRYFRATGRDVDTDEEGIAYDEATRRLRANGGDRTTNERRQVEHAIKCHLQANRGASGEDIRRHVRSVLRSIANDTVTATVRDLIARGEVTVDSAAQRGQAHRHYLAGTVDPFAVPG